MTPMKLRTLVIITALLTLFGCVSVQTPSGPVEWQSHQARLAGIRAFQLSGKLGYISPQERQSLNFQWQKNATSSQLRLTNFLGQTVLNLAINASGATVTTYDDKIFHNVSAEALVYELTGLSIPVEKLEDWILGLPSDADAYTLGRQHTLATLDKQIHQQTWHVDYTSYQAYETPTGELPLPHKLKLTQNQTKLNIVISKWKLTL